MGCIAKLLKETPDACIRPPTLPRNTRNTLHKFINRHEPLTEDVLDPVLDLWCDFIVLRRLRGEVGEQATNLVRDRTLAVVKVGHCYQAMKGVAVEPCNRSASPTGTYNGL